MKWAGGAGRRKGLHMVHTFEEIRARTPANLNEAALDANMPQAAWEALLRDVVLALCPPYTPQTLRRWLQATHPQAWAIRAPQAAPSTPPLPHQEGKGHGQKEDKGQKGTLWHGGKEGPKVMGRRPQGQGTGSDTTWEQDTTHGPRRGRNRDRGAEKEVTTTGTRAHKQEGHATTEGTTPPHPQRAPHDPSEAHAPNTRRENMNRTPYGPHGFTPTSHQKSHRGRGAHLHGEEGLHPQRKPPRTQPRSPPPRPHRQATTPAAARATSQTPEEEESAATAPLAEGQDPQRTRDHSTSPLKEDNPTDT